MQTNDLDFNQLKKLWTLKLVVETGGLQQAATLSKVSVSAVSQTLTTLERSLGRKLFLRKDRRLFPTTFCTEILGAIEPAFKTFADIQVNHLPACEIPKMTWLDFGVSESLAGNVLPRFVSQMKEKLPEMKLKLRIGKSEELTKLVRKGHLCMAVVAANEDHKGLSSYDLFQDRLGLYTSALHRGPDLNVSLSDEINIASVLPSGDGHPLYYSRFLKALDKNYRISLTSDNHETLLAIAASGTMPAILPEKMAMRTPGLLKEIPLAKMVKPVGQFNICLVSQKTCDPAEDQFLISELKSIL